MELRFKLNRYLADLEFLVNQDSGTSFPEGVQRIGDYLSDRFKKMAWSVKKHDFHSTIGPCYEIVNTSRPDFDVLLMGHLDTVFPVGTTSERPFSLIDDRAFGPGVGDMKSGLLLMLHVLEILESENRLKDHSLCVALNSDEEISSAYSRPWIESLSKNSIHALVLEPGRPDHGFVKERKGVGRFFLEFTGVASHSGSAPEKGRSAVTELGHWIVYLHNLNRPEMGTTINVGVVSGGTAVNVVPAQAQACVDFRYKDPQALQAFENELKNMGTHPRVPGVSVRISGGGTRPPMNPSPKTEQLALLAEKVGKEIGLNIHWTPSGGGSDGNFSAYLGIPTLDGLGPVGHNAHGLGESIEINSIEPRLNLLMGILLRLPVKARVG